MQEKYLGWKNHDTWSVGLILNNDQGLYLEICGWVEDQTEDKETVTKNLASYISNFINEAYEGATANHKGWVYDLINELVDLTEGNIDYEEIAEGFLEDYEPDEEEAEDPETP